MGYIIRGFFQLKSILVVLIAVIAISVFNLFGHVYALDVITEFPSRGGLWSITSGSDGNLWFVPNDDSNMIGRISPNGTITDFPLPTYLSHPLGIASGIDGNLWFTESGANNIGRITPNGSITEFPIPTNRDSFYIASGPDGNLWFTEVFGNKIGRISTSGLITEFPVSTSGTPYGIASGPDGNIWFTEYNGNKIGRITPDGTVTEFQVPTNNRELFAITSGPDGNLWFTESDANKIGKITPEGIVSEFSVPTNDSHPHGITTGPDGNLWFTEINANKIGRITPEGFITEFPVPPGPTNNSSPAGITVGSDGNIWFTEYSNNKIGRVNLSSLTPTPTPTPTPTILNVPYFNQNVLPWGLSEYDHSQSLGFSNIAMDRWGCAVTSVAMVLNYHSIKQFIDGTPINPGSLNKWLNDNNGYLTGYGSDGPYSYLNWPVIGTLTKLLFDGGKSSIKLEHRRAYPSAATTNVLNNDLTIGNDLGRFPDILGVTNVLTSGHFVVAKGVLSNTYAINDPEWNYPDLTQFNNTYTQVDRYIPSHTNLSYFLLVINPNIELFITDSYGRKTGKYIHDGITETFNQIPSATYAFETPIVNPDSKGNSEQLGTGVHAFLLPEPVNGDYTITISSNTSANYTLNTSAFQDNGSNNISMTEGTIFPNTDNSFILTYSQIQPSTVSKVVTFQSAIDDINELYKLNLITKKNVASNLVHKIEQVQKDILAGKTKLSLQKLNQFIDLLQKRQGKGVTQRAYEILLYDAESLIKKYSN